MTDLRWALEYDVAAGLSVAEIVDDLAGEAPRDPYHEWIHTNHQAAARIIAGILGYC